MKGNTFSTELNGKGLKVAMIVARFNPRITGGLKEGCELALTGHGVEAKDIHTYEVPGSFEIPLVAKQLATNGKYHAVVALGAVIRGETPHFDFVANEAAAGIARASYDTGCPVIFGVLTTDNLKQAEIRSANDRENKGYEAGLAAIEMVQLMKKIKG